MFKSIIEMIEKKKINPWVKDGFNSGYDQACDDIIEQLRKMSDCAIVPIEPTTAMLDEINLTGSFTNRALTVRYKAMLSAAPSKAL